MNFFPNYKSTKIQFRLRVLALIFAILPAIAISFGGFTKSQAASKTNLVQLQENPGTVNLPEVLVLANKN